LFHKDSKMRLRDSAFFYFSKRGRIGPWHKCSIKLANDEEFYREVNVKDMLIRKQGECALFDQYLHEEANITDENFPKQFNVVADVVAGTFNIYAMKNLVPVDGMCFQTNDGMFGENGAYQLILAGLVNLRGGPVADMQFPNVIREGKFLNVESKETNIRQMVESAYEIRANTLASVLNTKLKNIWTQVYRVIWVSGGVEQEKKYIANLMGDKVVQIFGDRFSNARGGRKIVLRYAKAIAAGRVKPKPTGGNIGQTEVSV